MADDQYSEVDPNTVLRALNRSIPGLSSSTRYVARVRAFSQLGVPSDWSEALVFETPGDTSVPGPPRNLQIDFTSGTLFLDWDPPLFNTNGTLVTDLSHYKVLLVNEEQSISYDTRNSFFSYSFEKNKVDFGDPKPTFDVSIFSVDVQGNLSPALTGIALNPVPQDPPAAPTLSSAFTLINISMAADPVDRDVSEFLLYHSLDGNAYSFLAVTGSNYTHEVSPGSLHYYKFKVRDIFGQESADFSDASSVTTEAAPGEDLTPPNTPQDFTAAADDGAGNFYIDPITKRPYIEASWSPNAPANLGYYELVYEAGDSAFVQYVQIPPQASTYRLTGLQEDTTYTLRLYAYSSNSVRSNSSGDVVVTTGHFQGVPNIVTGYRTTSGIKTITVNWDPHPDQFFRYFELYASTDPDDLYYVDGATPSLPDEAIDPSFLVYSGNATSYLLPTPNSADTWYFRVRAVNSFGTRSSLVPTPENFNDFSDSSIETAGGEPPAVPTGVVLSPGADGLDTFMDVSWTDSPEPNVVGYMVRLARVGMTNYQYKTVSDDTNAVRFSGLLPGVEYFAQVSAFNSAGAYSSFSAPVSETTTGDGVAPPEVENILLRAGIRTILVEWDASTVPDFAYYKIYVGETEEFVPTEDNLVDSPGVGTIAAITKFYDETPATPTFADLVPGTRYYVKLRAVDTSGNEGPIEHGYDADNPNEPGIVVGRAGDNDIEELFVDKLRSGNLTAAVALLGQIYTSLTGARLEISSAGIVGYGLDGATPNFEYTTVDQPSRGMAAGDVRISGALTAGSSISIGSLPNVFRVDDSGFMWFGANEFTDAPFRVSNEGSVLATDITILGNQDATPNDSDLLINTPNFVVTQGGDVIADDIIANGGLIAGATIEPTFTATLLNSVNVPAGGLYGGEVFIEREGAENFDSAGVFSLHGYAFTYTSLVLEENQAKFTGVQGGIEGIIPTTSPVYQGGLTGGLINGSNFLIPTGGGIQFTGDGNITWGDSAAGKIQVGGQGSIQSSNYNEDSFQGWYLGPEGLNIYDGVIKGSALQIQASSVNLFKNASFENGTLVATDWEALEVNCDVDFAVSPDEVVFQTKSQRVEVISTTAVARAGVYQDVYPSVGNWVPGDPFAIGFYYRQLINGQPLRNVRVEVWEIDSVGTQLDLVWLGDNKTIDSGDTWAKYETTFALDENETVEGLRVYFYFNGAEVNDVFFIDGGLIAESDYVPTFSPAPLDIPDNYIQDTHIQTLTADKIRTGFIGPQGLGNSVDIFIGPNGTISSLNYNENLGVGVSGFQIRNDRMFFQNGAIEIFAGGTGLDSTGYVKLDGSGLTLNYNNDTKFKVNDDGVYIGGSDSTNADVYFDGSKTVFQSQDSGYFFTIDTSASIYNDDTDENEILLELKDALDNQNFYLTKDGLAYFKGGVIGLGGGVGFNVDNVGNLWVGHENRELAPFAIYANDHIFLRSRQIHVGGLDNNPAAWIGSTNFVPPVFNINDENRIVTPGAGWRVFGDGSAVLNNVTVSGHIEADTGRFAGDLDAASGTFAGDLTAGGNITGRDIYGSRLFGNEIYGAYIATAQTGQRIVLDGTDPDAAAMIQLFTQNDGALTRIHAVSQGDTRYEFVELEGVGTYDTRQAGVKEIPITDDGLMINTEGKLYLDSFDISIRAKPKPGEQDSPQAGHIEIAGGRIDIISNIQDAINTGASHSPIDINIGGDPEEESYDFGVAPNIYLNAFTYIREADFSDLDSRGLPRWRYYRAVSRRDAATKVVRLDGVSPYFNGQNTVGLVYGGPGSYAGVSSSYARQDHKHSITGDSHSHNNYASISHVHQGSDITSLESLEITSDESTALDARYGGVRGSAFYVHDGFDTVARMTPLAPHQLFIRNAVSGGVGLLWHGGEVRVVSNSGNATSYKVLAGILDNRSSRTSKNSISSIGYDVLPQIENLDIVQFKYNDLEEDRFRMGVIAEQAESINDTIAFNGMVNGPGLASMALKGIQELNTKVRNLEAEIERLKNATEQ